MRINRRVFLLSVLAIGASGCSRSPELVYVDLSQVPPPRGMPAPLPPPKPTASKIDASKFSIPSQPKSQLYFAGNEERLREAEAAIRKNREEAFHEIAKRLQDAAYHDVERIFTEAAKDLEPKAAERIDAVYDQLRDIFLRYAFQVGTATFGLANIVGFPDPDPNSKRVPDPSDTTAYRRFTKAKELRKTMNELSASFRREFEGKLSVASSENAAELTALKIEMAKLLEEYLAQAQSEAERLTESSMADIHVSSALKNVPLAALPSYHVDVPASPNPERAPIVKSAQISEPVENELAIFLKVRNYQQARDPQARNVTEEFIAWRKRFRDGL